TAARPLPIHRLTEIEQDWDRDLQVPLPAVDEGQIAALDPPLQRRVADAEEPGGKALRHGLPQLRLELGTHASDVPLSRCIALGSPEACDLLEAPELAVGGVHDRKSNDESFR